MEEAVVKCPRLVRAFEEKSRYLDVLYAVEMKGGYTK